MRTCSPRHPCVHSEAGFAVPIVMLALVAMFGLGTAVVVASIDSQRGTVRDQDTKEAVAAAEAGLANAVLRYNRLDSSTNPCAPVGGTLTTGNWCTTAGSGTIDRGGYSYRVRVTPAVGSLPAQLKVVSMGTVDGVTRRVTAVADTVSAGYRPFSGLASVVALDGITLNADAEIHADVATNGNIAMNSGSLIDCDYLQVGVGMGLSPNNGGTATCPVTQGTVSLPPVNPGDVATNNSNSRICTLDPCVKANWSSGPKPRLSFNSGGSITLGSSGGEFNYAFCRLMLNANSYLYVAAGATVRIYFLPPESCDNESQPLILSSSSKIQPTGSGVANLAILIVGSDVRSTSAILNADSVLFDCDQRFVFYAPRTSVTMNSRTNICGGVAAKSLIINADATITDSVGAQEFELPGEEVASHYGEPHDFVECSGAPNGAVPDDGC